MSAVKEKEAHPIGIMNKSQIKALYDGLSEQYGSRYAGFSRRYFYAMEEECIYQLAEFSKKRVLDLGTGSGRMAFSLLREGDVGGVIGIDLSSRSVKLAHTHPDRGVRATFCVMDGEGMAFRESVFDSVVALGTFEYVADLSPYFREIGRVLKPGGELIFSCWNRYRWFGWRLFDDRMKGSVDHTLPELEGLLAREGFRLVSSMTSFFTPTRIFFGLHRRIPFGDLLQERYLKGIIGIERLLRKSFLSRKGGEWIIRSQKCG